MRQPQSSANRSLSLSTRLAVALSTGLMLLPSAFSQEYGSAPQSLDYATATGAHELEASAEFNILDQVNEFFFFSERNPFEGQVVKTTDPTGKKSAKVLTGPAFKVRRENPNFDFYRYVTFYDVETRRDRIFDLPIQRQECHDNSDYFASYEYSYKIKTEVSAGIEIGSVGLNATVGTERQYRANRSLRAVPGVIA